MTGPQQCSMCHGWLKARELIFARWCGKCWKKHPLESLWAAWLRFLYPPCPAHEAMSRGALKVVEARRAANPPA